MLMAHRPERQHTVFCLTSNKEQAEISVAEYCILQNIGGDICDNGTLGRTGVTADHGWTASTQITAKGCCCYHLVKIAVVRLDLGGLQGRCPSAHGWAFRWLHKPAMKPNSVTEELITIWKIPGRPHARLRLLSTVPHGYRQRFQREYRKKRGYHKRCQGTGPAECRCSYNGSVR